MSSEIRLFHLPFSFMLPQRVANEQGYFADEGLHVELYTRDRSVVDWKYIPSEDRLTNAYGVDVYPICKWESIKRTWEMKDGRIVAIGTFGDLPYEVFVRPDSPIESPRDLAGVPIGVNLRTGQEYTVLRAMEQYVDHSDIELQHLGMPTDRLRALKQGEIEAISLLEPQSALAEHLGFRSVLEFENHVGIVGSETIDTEVVTAFLNAYERAAREINGDPISYKELYLEMLFDDATVEPELFEDVAVEELADTISVPRFEAPKPVDPGELDDQLEWMKRRQLIDPDADLKDIVFTPIA